MPVRPATPLAFESKVSAMAPPKAPVEPRLIAMVPAAPPARLAGAVTVKPVAEVVAVTSRLSWKAALVKRVLATAMPAASRRTLPKASTLAAMRLSRVAWA